MWILLIVIVMTGCGKSEKTEEDKKVLTFSWWGDEEVHHSTLEAIKIYEQLNPTIEIRADYQDEQGYFQKIVTQMANGNLPDIFQYKCGWYGQSVAGAIDEPCDLNALDIDFAGTEEWLEQCSTQDGKVIIYPIAIDCNVLIANQDFLNKYDLKAEELRTWSDILQRGEEIRNMDGNSYLLQMSVDDMNEVFLPLYLKQLTGKEVFAERGDFNFESGQLAQALEVIDKMYKSNLIPRMNADTMVSGNADQRRWERGKIGIKIDTLNGYLNQTEKSDIPIMLLPMPQIEDKETSSEFEVQYGYGISSNTKYPKESADFVQWLASSTEAYEEIKWSRGVPANQNIRKNLEENEILHMYNINAQKNTENDKDYSTGHEELTDLQKRVLIRMLNGEIDSKEAAWQMMTEITKIW